jgi:RNA polymerase sigma factor (sigma-70 family)
MSRPAMAKKVWRASCIGDRMQEKSDLELIACGKDGDRESIAELFRRYYPASLSVARRILHCGDESQDAVQKAYLLAFRHLSKFRGDACFKTWITRIVVNCCLRELREARCRITWVRPEDSGIDVLASESPTPEESTWRGEIAEACSDAAQRLPGHLCEVYKLHLVLGLSIKKVAVTLGVTESTAKMRLFRARAGMRSHLKPVWSEIRVDCATSRSRSSHAQTAA